MTTTHPIHRELDHAYRNGPVRDIVIPPCPELLRQLQEATAHSEPDIGAVDQIASADVAMAAALIRQANSPLYALNQPVHTVGQALIVLGLRPAVQLLTGFLTRHSLQVKSPLLAHFWENSTRRALACEHIGYQLYNLDPSLAYSFGLFCHVGMPILMRGVKDYGGTIIEALARKYHISQDLLMQASKQISVLGDRKIPQISGWLERVASTFEQISSERVNLMGRLRQIAEMSIIE